MVAIETCRKIALSYEGATAVPHFEKPSFRINKKIFLTLDEKNKRAAVKLSPVEQSVFCVFDSAIIYPATGAWGKQGWTLIELNSIKKELIRDAINSSYCNVAPRNLAEKYKSR